MENTVKNPVENKLPTDTRAFVIVALAAIAWFTLYNVIQPFADWLSYKLLALPKDSHLGESLAFFFYDVPNWTLDKI